MCNTYNDFKIGVGRLVEIQRNVNHTFYKHNSCYEIDYFLNEVFPKCNLPEEKIILDYFEKLTTCDSKIESEVSAIEFCGSDVNGFLGVNFQGIDINIHKKITDQAAYENWIQHYQSNFEKMTTKFSNTRHSNKFKKDFDKLSNVVQEAILSKIDDAIAQNCIKQPDGIIIKEVSISNKCKILELRVFSPVALRMYFNFKNNIIFLASIEQKSNPNQNEDIKNAEKLLIHLNTIG
jgi:hypothetical protein